jgi:glycosyltransferase involved in cell wall biosynthesis
MSTTHPQLAFDPKKDGRPPDLRGLEAPSVSHAPGENGGRLLRVLYAADLDPFRKFGSLEEQVLLLARAFRARGGLFLPLFLPRTGCGEITGYQAAGLEFECLDLRKFRWTTLRRLLGLIVRHRIEVVHWNFYPPLVNWYLWWLTVLMPRVKHFFTDHNSRFVPAKPPGGFWKKAAKSVLLRRYSKVHCVSNFVLRCLQREESWSNLACLTHFINTERFQPDPAVRAAVRKRFGQEGCFVLLTVANLIKPKGIDIVLRALPGLPESVVFWVVGEGQDSARLERLCRELSLEGRVRFLGSQRHVNPYMQAADCLVCPSLWEEAAGLVNIEAEACGLPVVASNKGGISEYVEDGRTGFLFPAGDHLQLAERIRQLLEAPQTRRDMGLAARTLAVERFSAAARLGEYLDLYRSSV